MTYPEAPTYIAHTDGGDTANQWVLMDGEGNTLTFTVQADTVTINGVTYYDSAKVDSLIQETKSWATEQFQPKAAG